MRDIRILHIISGNDGGGAKTHLLNLCLNSGSLFNNIIGCINEGVLYHEALEKGIETVLFHQKSRFDLSISKNIKNYILKNKIDIVNFHGANPNFIYVFLKADIKTPCVTTIHSDYRYDFINNKLKYLLFTPLNSYAIKSFKSHICVSEKIKELLEKKGMESKKYVVNNGINSDVQIIESPDEIRKNYKIKMDSFVYTMVARMHPIKNHINLIKAFEKLSEELKDVYLLLVGDGEMKSTLKSTAAALGLDGKVIFTGRKENAIDYINAGDINILTSFNETFSLVVLEGAIVNKAVICSDVGDIKKLVNKENGFIVNPNDIDDIYEKMKLGFMNKENLPSMGKKLHDAVIENYSMDKFCQRYFDSYKSIIEGETNG
ncbi:putative teichuronic acid biosynthesis glycosyltransferase TuaC [Oxobacter pfennigii]|uniref:Putative teichuronic acid biosynthesis glycosyltransferase TuaC n=1 Tax=Oxobacter pfennigii TaxID=36849 RepID=A0A0P8Z2K5_9CLOT|nr:glycosyltransferase [Oxobacter pfennigii]KPU46382.1 putative teichuronic acid biosynthesis glycosyltransferase TuaC [Oxobacter pfennigii]